MSLDSAVQPELVYGHKKIKPPAGMPVWDVDPYSEDFIRNPKPHYADLRALGPIAYLPKYNVLACAQYETTHAIFSNHEVFSSTSGIGLSDINLEKPWRPRSVILEVDPPIHTQMRRVLMRALSPKVVRDLRARLAAAAEEMIDNLIDTEFDAVWDFTVLFVATEFPKAVGMKEVDVEKLVNYGEMIFNGVGPKTPWEEQSFANAKEVVPWIYEHIERDTMEKTGIADTLFEAADAGEITEEDAKNLARALLSAGIDTTVSTLAQALMCLAENPDQLELLNSDPDKYALPVFEETLRLRSPIQHFYRTAKEDTEIAGFKVEEGTKVLCNFLGANLDPAKWPDPERFDLTRKTVGHMSLGAGIHSCVGQNIARAEGQELFRALGRKVRKIEVTGEPVQQLNNAMRAYKKIPMRFGS